MKGDTLRGLTLWALSAAEIGDNEIAAVMSELEPIMRRRNPDFDRQAAQAARNWRTSERIAEWTGKVEEARHDVQ